MIRRPLCRLCLYHGLIASQPPRDRIVPGPICQPRYRILRSIRPPGAAFPPGHRRSMMRARSRRRRARLAVTVVVLLSVGAAVQPAGASPRQDPGATDTTVTPAVTEPPAATTTVATATDPAATAPNRPTSAPLRRRPPPLRPRPPAMGPQRSRWRRPLTSRRCCNRRSTKPTVRLPAWRTSSPLPRRPTCRPGRPPPNVIRTWRPSGSKRRTWPRRPAPRRTKPASRATSWPSR